jgi:peptidoglycan/LPS O-acetylase OafA/YrhL
MVADAPEVRNETERLAHPDVGRIEYIDGLRGVAVLTVLISHIALHAQNMNPLLYHILQEGSHGVDLFFVLSGFCLAYPALKAWRLRDAVQFDVASYAAKRIVRILPPFYLATGMLLVIALAVRLSGHAGTLTIPSPGDLLRSLVFLDLHNHLINGSFWTLMVEFRWYFLFPVALMVWFRSPRAFFALAAACVILYTLTRARGLDVGTLPAFLFGIVAADLHLGMHVRPDLARAVRRFALPLAIVCAGIGIAYEGTAMIPGFEGADVAWAYQPTILGWQLATFLFVVAAGALSSVQRLLNLRALVATGIASYAIYLVHEPIVDVMDARFPGPAGWVAGGAIALAVGFGFWASAERPFTTGPLRRPLLNAVEPGVRRCFAFLRTATTVSLRAAGDEVR